MSRRHQIREVAVQALYQLDLRGEQDAEQVRATVDDAPVTGPMKQAAWELALGAWGRRADADRLSGELAPGWPAHRQPAVDRSILRLAYHELADVGTPAAVAIDEAVELAKTFGSQRSPAFINGVLDKMAKRIERERPAAGEGGTGVPPVIGRHWMDDAAAEPSSNGAGDTAGGDRPAADPWLDDAIRNARPTDSDK